MATITIKTDIKTDIATKVAEQAHPGYSKTAQGQWFVVDGSRLVHAEQNRPWNPWNDGDEVVSVDDLVWYCGGAEQDNADFDPSGEDDGAWERAVEFALEYVPDSYDPTALPYEQDA